MSEHGYNIPDRLDVDDFAQLHELRELLQKMMGEANRLRDLRPANEDEDLVRSARKAREMRERQAATKLRLHEAQRLYKELEQRATEIAAARRAALEQRRLLELEEESKRVIELMKDTLARVKSEPLEGYESSATPEEQGL